jgi:uroporphyrinogen III methyltransferase/synthase
MSEHDADAPSSLAGLSLTAVAGAAELPLTGLTVAVTRAASQAAPLATALARLGARAVVCPVIELVPPDDTEALDAAIGRLGDYSWVIFTSANGVERFFARIAAAKGDVRRLARARIAAVGPATARAVGERGLAVDLVPDEFVADGLFAALEAAGPLAGARVLLARAAVGRDVLPDALRRAGAEVDVVEAYRTVRCDANRALVTALVDGGLDLVTFTSSSTVTGFVDLAGPDRARGARAACLGPVTAATARAAGLDVAVEADPYTVEGLVAAIERWSASRRIA